MCKIRLHSIQIRNVFWRESGSIFPLSSDAGYESFTSYNKINQ